MKGTREIVYLPRVAYFFFIISIFDTGFFFFVFPPNEVSLTASFWSKLMKHYQDSPLRTNWKSLRSFSISSSVDLAYVTSYKNFHTSWVTIITLLPLRPQDGVRKNLLSNLKTDSEILVIVFSILKNFPMKNSNMNKSNATSVHGKSFQLRHLRRETAVSINSRTAHRSWSRITQPIRNLIVTSNRGIKIRYN